MGYLIVFTFLIAFLFHTYVVHKKLTDFAVAHILNIKSNWDPNTDRFNTFLTISFYFLSLFLCYITHRHTPDIFAYKAFSLVGYSILALFLIYITVKLWKKKICPDEELIVDFDNFLIELKKKNFYDNEAHILINTGYEDACDLVPYHILIYFFKNSYLKRKVHATIIIDLFQDHFSLPNGAVLNSNNYKSFKNRYVKKNRLNVLNFYSDLTNFIKK